jgi:hypothetical protein
MRYVLEKLSIVNLVILQLEHPTPLFQILLELSFELFQMLIYSTKVLVVVTCWHWHLVWVDELAGPIEVPVQPLALVRNLSVGVVKRAVAVALSLIVSLADVSGAVGVKSHPVLYIVKLFYVRGIRCVGLVYVIRLDGMRLIGGLLLLYALWVEFSLAESSVLHKVVFGHFSLWVYFLVRVGIVVLVRMIYARIFTRGFANRTVEFVLARVSFRGLKVLFGRVAGRFRFVNEGIAIKKLKIAVLDGKCIMRVFAWGVGVLTAHQLWVLDFVD